MENETPNAEFQGSRQKAAAVALHCTPSESLILSKILYHGWTPMDTDSEEASATRDLLSVSIRVHPWLNDFGCGLAWLGRAVTFATFA